LAPGIRYLETVAKLSDQDVGDEGMIDLLPAIAVALRADIGDRPSVAAGSARQRVLN
jgi:hypothetical protein